MLDPACGDGRFLAYHRASVGIEFSSAIAKEARLRAPWALVHQAEFFGWAEQTTERFEVAAGNPPFIRYQRFTGETRKRALRLCALQGAHFSGLTASWAPFLVATSSLLKPGGRMAFVVPAKICHATYATPLIEFLVSKFRKVLIVAIREKIFANLSEDAWLLYAEGYGESTKRIGLTLLTHFSHNTKPPQPTKWVSIDEWRKSGGRLRRYVLKNEILGYYDYLSTVPGVVSLGSVASTGIGYVSGDNDFFHLRPSEAEELGIPNRLLRVTVRNGRQIKIVQVDTSTVKKWLADDMEVLLLDLSQADSIPKPVQHYLNSKAGRRARERYKCRTRTPWYVVPDTKAPDAFITYMNGREPGLVPNMAGCVCTNSLLAVRLKNNAHLSRIVNAWKHPLARLSQEIEGHPLGGGMLKLEPGEAARVWLPVTGQSEIDTSLLVEGVSSMQKWRHYD